MAVKPVRLGNGKAWPTQSAAKKHFQAILHSYRPGDRITDPSHIEDINALIDSFDAGWDGPKKKAKPISYFSVDHNRAEGRTTPSVFIHYEDGSRDDLSLRKAVEWTSRRG